MVDNETRRLASLRELKILDTEPEIQFDSIAQAAAIACGTSASLITFVDAERQWAKANFGLPGLDSIAREAAFCSHTILQDDILEIVDASADPRFAQNPLVTGDSGIRFYAGVPLKMSDGRSAGALCVIDQKPRKLDAAQSKILRLLAIATEKAIEGRNALRHERKLRSEIAAIAAAKADSEARFRVLSETLPIGVFQGRADGWFIYINTQCQKIYQASVEEALGFGWTARLHPDDRSWVLEQWRKAAEIRGTIDLEFRIKLPDSSDRVAKLEATPSLDHAGNIKSYVGTIQDVTEARQMRAHLVSEQRRLADILECTGAGTWEMNVQTGEVRLDENAVGMLGYTLAEFGNTTIQTVIDLSPPDDLPRSQELFAKHLRNETSLYELEGRLRHRDGYWLWVLQRGRVLTRTQDGKPEWIFGTYLDITARKQNEFALQKSDWLMRRTGEVAGVGGWVWDVNSGAVNWTGHTRAIHGVPEDYVPTFESLIKFYPPEAREILDPVNERALATGEPYDLELPFIKADGTPIWVRVAATVEFENGQPVRVLGAIQDITEKHTLVAELTEQHALLSVTLNSIADAVITTDARGNISLMNPVAEQLTGHPNGKAIGKSIDLCLMLKEDENSLTVAHPVAKCLATSQPVKLINGVVLQGLSGQQRGVEASTWPILGADRELLGCVLTLHDVTEQRRLTKEIYYRATRDNLTGMLNRIEFERALQDTIEDNQMDKKYRAMMYIDLDDFKLINDSFSHAAGDEILLKISKLIANLAGPKSVCGRLGGDEFGIITDICTPESASIIAERICSFMDHYRFSHEGKKSRVGVSIGLVPLDGTSQDSASIMKAADLACYTAKDSGRNQVHVWSETDDSLNSRHRDMRWASRLKVALDEDRFLLYAQKILPVSGHANALRAEVLLRLEDDNGEIIMPGRFIPAAERFNLISKIDRWVIDSVIERLKNVEDLSKILALSVNISGQSIDDRSFHQHVMALLSAAGNDICKRICLEITETAAVNNLVQAKLFIQSIKKLGVRVALDDFGAGASSFGYLKELPVDYIKIDGKFISGMIGDPLNSLVVRSFVDAARLLNLQTVAEFVNSPAIFDCVEASGIDFIQGYLAHHPEPLDALLVT